MCTARIFNTLTKENIKNGLTQAGVVGYSVTNAVMYIKDPSLLLASTLSLLMNAVNPENEEVNRSVDTGVSYAVVSIAALCLALQNYKAYSKMAREYSNRASSANSAAENDIEAASAPIPVTAPKLSCGEKFKSHTAALLKTVGASYSWYNLVNSIPVSGFPVLAAVTTALSVPGNIYTQLALLSPKPVVMPTSDVDNAYHRMGS